MIQKLEMGHFLVPPKRRTSSRKRQEPCSPHTPRDNTSSETLGRMERSTYCTMLGRNR